MSAYYNENDPYAAQWLRNLIAAGHIAPGDVDERSIVDVRADDLRSYTQCHFFAGIGGWSYALRLAGWPDDRPVWTGSCPCQPLSVAGKQKGIGDQRHLWPAWFRLIQERKPPILFGEQVAGTLGLEWLAGVHLELETAAYSFGAADLCAAGAGAPHVRSRHFFVAYADGQGIRDSRRAAIDRAARRMQSSNGQRERFWADTATGCDAPIMADADRSHGHWWSGPLQVGWNAIEGEVERGGRKYRAQWRVKPGLPLLADGIPNRMERCSAYGNAIVPQVAAEFIKAAMP